ncbi:ABC transporter ATP-binding protein [Paenibacillus arenosi]|uniref:ABC transporter ATP-binding protein n=1 Tax=Paenibacillus arenosi TaxID=2774142 RepID=A0ABR9B285_9BACL|nr:ABC transporter ATP-binding protein [Paenibacillus arenosi]MBD8499537.1 ABC transporter ATP-binding protein [Paenibacillus arenosi]
MQVEKIRIEQLRKQFVKKNKMVEAFHSISLQIKDGEFVSIVGPSGCGKTTLLRVIAGLELPTSGTMHIQHHDSNQPLNAMVFQEHSIFPWMTVRENIAYGLTMRKVPPSIKKSIVDHYLLKINMVNFAESYPHQLSGGMKQRVSVARAFANDPEILLMDEPFTALDEQNRLLIQQELLKIWEENQKTVVFITHSIEEAILLSDRIIMMSAHPGTLIAEYEIPFPRPRKIEEIRSSTFYKNMFNEIWMQLKEEVEKSRSMEGMLPI